MSSILGFEFYLGPEVPAPEVDTTPADWKATRAVRWRPLIVEAVREHDAWGLLVTEPDGDVQLLDVYGRDLDYRAHLAAMIGGRVHLLLAREAPERLPTPTLQGTGLTFVDCIFEGRPVPNTDGTVNKYDAGQQCPACGLLMDDGDDGVCKWCNGQEFIGAATYPGHSPVVTIGGCAPDRPCPACQHRIESATEADPPDYLKRTAASRVDGT